MISLGQNDGFSKVGRHEYFGGRVVWPVELRQACR